MVRFNWKLFSAIACITGTVIGAGFLGVPFVVGKSGFLIGIIEIILIGLLMTVINLFLGEILLRTQKTHQLPGLAQIYLGKIGGKVMFYSMLLGIYLSSIAYLLGEGESLSYLFFQNSGYSLFFAFLLFLLVSLFVYKGMRSLKKGESIGLILVSFIMLLIIIFFCGDIKYENLASFDIHSMFVPLGVIIFALMGFSAIPESRRVLIRHEKMFKRSIAYAMLVSIVTYSIFTLIVLGYSGSSTPEIATISLGKPFILLGILTMFTAYFGTTMALRDIYRFDLGYKKFRSWTLSCFVPFILFLIVYIFKLADFIGILGFIGSVFGTLDVIMILLMVRKARKFGKRKPEYIFKIPVWIAWIVVFLLVAALIFKVV